MGSINPVKAIYLSPQLSGTVCLHILSYKKKRKKERKCIGFLLLKRWVWKILRNLVCMWLVATLIRVGEQLPSWNLTWLGQQLIKKILEIRNYDEIIDRDQYSNDCP